MFITHLTHKEGFKRILVKFVLVFWWVLGFFFSIDCEVDNFSQNCSVWNATSWM